MDRPDRWKTLALLLSLAYLLSLPFIPYLQEKIDEQEPRTRHFQVRGHTWAWEVQEGQKWDFSQEAEAARIVVNKGDTVVLHLLSEDVAHGFMLVDFNVMAQLNHMTVKEVSFVADKAGHFTFRCHLNCGNQHPYMVGEMVVEPNPLRPAGYMGVMVFGLVGLAWGMSRPTGQDPLLYANLKTEKGQLRGSRFNQILQDRRPQFILQAIMAGGFAFAIFTGLAGLQNGGQNLSVVAVWLVWWFLLVAVAVPLVGRAWCGVCPLPLPGEWLARGKLLAPSTSDAGTDQRMRWPLPRWGLTGSFAVLLTMAATSMLLTTTPWTTGLALLLLWVMATVVTFRYQGRSFCRHLCPIAPFLSLYGRLAPLTLEACDSQQCRSHGSKQCIKGGDRAWGCSWQRYPGKADTDGSCGYCMECFRSCSQQNVTLAFRSSLPRMLAGRLRKDEVVGAAMLLGLLFTYQIVMLGPYGGLKDAAGMNNGLLAYLGFLVLLLGMAMLLPALLWGTAELARRTSRELLTAKELRTAGALGLLPFGLLSWIAFKFPVFLNSWYYIVRVASDPLGVGWNLFGTAQYHGEPILPELFAKIQVILVLAGLLLGVRLTTMRLARPEIDLYGLMGGILPLVLFQMVLAMSLIRLFGG